MEHEYLLDFINIEDPELVDEREIEQGIIQNIKNFLHTLQHSFHASIVRHYQFVHIPPPFR